MSPKSFKELTVSQGICNGTVLAVEKSVLPVESVLAGLFINLLTHRGAGVNKSKTKNGTNVWFRAVALVGFMALMLIGESPVMADSVIVYQGIDPNVTVGSTLTSSNAAQASYLAAASALGTYNLITFENAPLGNFTTLDLGNGVTLALTNTNTQPFHSPGINNSTNEPGFGFNTTPGGANFFRFVTQYINNGASTSADATFSFAAPVTSFGGYFTGLGGGGDSITINFTNGVSETFNLALSNTPSCNPSCAEFFGFTDAGSSVNSIDLNIAFTNTSGQNNFAYFVGVDDVQFTTVPEPGTFALLGTGLLSMRLLLSRFRGVNASRRSSAGA